VPFTLWVPTFVENHGVGTQPHVGQRRSLTISSPAATGRIYTALFFEFRQGSIFREKKRVNVFWEEWEYGKGKEKEGGYERKKKKREGGKKWAVIRVK
jgi:hypothetical protein